MLCMLWSSLFHSLHLSILPITVLISNLIFSKAANDFAAKNLLTDKTYTTGPQKVDNAIHWTNLHPIDNVIGFAN